MKILKSCCALVLSAALLSNMLSVFSVNALSPSAPPNNSFLWQGETYQFVGSTVESGLASGEYVENVTVAYEHRASSYNNTLVRTTLGTISTDSAHHTVYDGKIKIPNFLNEPLAYYSSSGTFAQYGPYFYYTATTNKGREIVTLVKGSIIIKDDKYYPDCDKTFYYNSFASNSFRNAATGSIRGVGYTYNCMAYAFKIRAASEKEEGWIWPYEEGNNTVQNVINDAIGYGYSVNTLGGNANADVIAYGYYDAEDKTTYIKHFARVTKWGDNDEPTEITSKWGGLELIHSTDTDPFTDQSGYGIPIVYFNAP